MTPEADPRRVWLEAAGYALEERPEGWFFLELGGHPALGDGPYASTSLALDAAMLSLAVLFQQDPPKQNVK